MLIFTFLSKYSVSEGNLWREELIGLMLWDVYLQLTQKCKCMWRVLYLWGCASMAESLTGRAVTVSLLPARPESVPPGDALQQCHPQYLHFDAFFRIKIEEKKLYSVWSNLKILPRIRQGYRFSSSSPDNYLFCCSDFHFPALSEN